MEVQNWMRIKSEKPERGRTTQILEELISSYFGGWIGLLAWSQQTPLSAKEKKNLKAKKLHSAFLTLT